MGSSLEANAALGFTSCYIVLSTAQIINSNYLEKTYMRRNN